MLNQSFIKNFLTALFYFFVIFNIIIRIIVTKKRNARIAVSSEAITLHVKVFSKLLLYVSFVDIYSIID